LKPQIDLIFLPQKNHLFGHYHTITAAFGLVTKTYDHFHYLLLGCQATRIRTSRRVRPYQATTHFYEGSIYRGVSHGQPFCPIPLSKLRDFPVTNRTLPCSVRSAAPDYKPEVLPNHSGIQFSNIDRGVDRSQRKISSAFYSRPRKARLFICSVTSLLRVT
jgi:hypothetical protein